MKFIRSHKKIIVIMLIIILIVPTITFGRFIYNIIKDHFFVTKNFYFQSDLLNDDIPKYTISNWSGVDSYILTINMNSIKNEKKYATSDIYYDINYECDEKVECHLSKEKGVIRTTNEIERNRDSFTLTIIPKKAFSNNEETKIKISTSATSPYKKTIGAEFNLKASKIGLSYEITDNKNDIFAILRLTNSLTYYTVREAFLDYQIGDEIDRNIYENLDEENKKKCYSLTVKLKFDPKVVNMDLTNAYYLKVLKNNPTAIRTTKLRRVLTDFGTFKEGDLIANNIYNSLSSIEKNNVSDRYDYVSEVTIEIDAISSSDIKFYKKDKIMDYTYPFVNENSIIEIE